MKKIMGFLLLAIMSLNISCQQTRKTKCVDNFELKYLPIETEATIANLAADDMKTSCQGEYNIESITKEEKYIVYRYNCPKMCE